MFRFLDAQIVLLSFGDSHPIVPRSRFGETSTNDDRFPLVLTHLIRHRNTPRVQLPGCRPVPRFTCPRAGARLESPHGALPVDLLADLPAVDLRLSLPTAATASSHAMFSFHLCGVSSSMLPSPKRDRPKLMPNEANSPLITTSIRCDVTPGFEVARCDRYGQHLGATH
jgi:hypothetical protein